MKAILFLCFTATGLNVLASKCENTSGHHERLQRLDADSTPVLLRRYTPSGEALKTIKSNREVFQRRSIEGYDRMLGSESFRGALARLRAKDTWIDMGAGRAKAMMAYFRELKLAKRLKRLPRIYAISLSGKGRLIESLENGAKRLRSLAEKRPSLAPVIADLEGLRKSRRFGYLEIPLGTGAVLQQDLPKAKLITDVWGPMAYTNRADLVLNEYLSLLEVGGEILLHMHWKKLPQVQIGGETIDFLEWAQAHTPGIKIEEVENAPLAGTIRILKLEADTQVPVLRLDEED